MLYLRTNLSERLFQGPFHLADAGKEQVVTNSPNQQTRKGMGLRVESNVAVGFGTWKLAEHPSVWVAGQINQYKQGEYDPQGDAVHHAQRQLGSNDNHGIRE